MNLSKRVIAGLKANWQALSGSSCHPEPKGEGSAFLTMAFGEPYGGSHKRKGNDDIVITATQAPEKYLEIFDQVKVRTANQFSWLQKQREEAFARFTETGFPTTHDEDWRFTSVAAVANTQFELGPRVKIDKKQLEAFGLSVLLAYWFS